MGLEIEDKFHFINPMNSSEKMTSYFKEECSKYVEIMNFLIHNVKNCKNTFLVPETSTSPTFSFTGFSLVLVSITTETPCT